jgi:hypothetical protein
MYFHLDKISEEELREYIKNNEVSIYDWYHISRYQVLSEDFIKEFFNEIALEAICESQILSEDFIISIMGKLNKRCWVNISENQELSDDFIRKNKSNICWHYISKKKLSDKFCEEFDVELCNHNYDHDEWRINGLLHRTVGPAICATNVNKFSKYKKDSKEFWYRGQKAENVSNMEQYERWLNLRVFA